MKFNDLKFTLVYYLKNGQYGINYYANKEEAEKHLQFYLHNSNYATAKLYERKQTTEAVAVNPPQKNIRGVL